MPASRAKIVSVEPLVIIPFLHPTSTCDATDNSPACIAIEADHIPLPRTPRMPSGFSLSSRSRPVASTECRPKTRRTFSTSSQIERKEKEQENHDNFCDRCKQPLGLYEQWKLTSIYLQGELHGSRQQSANMGSNTPHDQTQHQPSRLNPHPRHP